MVTNILDYLEKSVSLYPEKVVFSDSKKDITYSELRKTAAAVASALVSKGIGTKKPVVVFIDRNIESLVSFMGTVMSGNFYVPVDRSLPAQRVKLIF